jgi:hypothetical protein
MAQTKKRRKRKRRGTQSGSINRTRRSRPRSREEAKAQARQRAGARKERTPSWGGAFWRGLLGAAIFFLMTKFVFGETTGRALGLSVVMLALYIPLSYYIDRFFYRRRLRQEREERARQRR